MKTLITLLFISLTLPFSVYAKTVTATGDTLDNTENKIRQLIKKEGGKSYKIIQARVGDKNVRITAKITS
ncbi:DUF1471 domain-containing protein [Pectobacterium sp. B1J-3]|uniref:DUF1471 domain-containing protein n=1 Tax=Pectobacterium sp. B1J-3 TaxID=3385371 RepID=UPI003905B980